MKPTPYLYLIPAFTVVGVLVLGLGYVVDASFRELDRATFLPALDYSLANYRMLIERPVYLIIFWRSLLAALIVTAACLTLAVPYAYVMVRTKSPGLRKLLLVSLFLPFFIGQVVRAYGWLIVLGNQGLVNEALALLGLGPYRMIYRYGAVLVGLVQYMLPFAILLLAPALVAVPEENEMAASSLGASWPVALTTVTLPMAKPGLVAAGITVFTITLTDFAMPEILGGGKNDFAANAVYDGFFAVSDAGLGSALAVALIALGSAAVAVLLWLFGGVAGRGRPA